MINDVFFCILLVLRIIIFFWSRFLFGFIIIYDVLGSESCSSTQMDFTKFLLGYNISKSGREDKLCLGLNI